MQYTHEFLDSDYPNFSFCKIDKTFTADLMLPPGISPPEGSNILRREKQAIDLATYRPPTHIEVYLDSGLAPYCYGALIGETDDTAYYLVTEEPESCNTPKANG